MVPSPMLAVPASLHASLMARLDRLGPAKEVAQIGAAIGREFSHALLAAVVRKPETELQSALNRLVEAGLLFRQGTPPNATYLFKHALVQDAAYGTLLREPRRALHARIAETLENQFMEIAENQPELLARHCTEAGLDREGRRPMGQGGTAFARTLGTGRSRGAAHACTRSDCILPDYSGDASRANQASSRAYWLLSSHQRFAAPKPRLLSSGPRLLIEQAEALGEPLEDPWCFFGPLRVLGGEHFGFNGKDMIEISRRIMALAERQGATIALMMGHRNLGVALMATGDISEGRRHSTKRSRSTSR